MKRALAICCNALTCVVENEHVSVTGFIYTLAYIELAVTETVQCFILCCKFSYAYKRHNRCFMPSSYPLYLCIVNLGIVFLS